MNFQENKIWIVIIAFLGTSVSFAQLNKDDISIVQFSAKFVQNNELSLESFNQYNVQTIYIEEHKELFKKEKIKYLPTLKLFNEGEQVLIITSDLSLKLPADAVETLNQEINNILKTKF